jgi:hypothetical protein
MNLEASQRDLLSFGTKFIPTALPNYLRFEQDFNLYARRIRIRYMFGNEPYNATFYLPKPTWKPDKAGTSEEHYLSSTAKLMQSVLTSAKMILNQSPKANLSHSQRLFLQRMSRDSSQFIIKPADKNLGLTLMDRSKYDEEVFRQLRDTTTYTRIADPALIPVQSIHDQLVQLFQGARQADLVTSDVLKYIMSKTTPTTSKLPNFYILAKVHKKTFAGRPIVPGFDWITTPASRWLDHVLQPLVKRISTLVSDSTSLLNALGSTRFLDPTCTLVTADVTSLYTEIPTDDGIATVARYLDRVRFATPAHRQLIVSVLALVLKNNYFTYCDGHNNLYYFHQKKGTAMGTPCAVVYANIYMYDLEYPILKEHRLTVLFYRRFLDDILIVTTGDNSALLSAFSSARPTIKLEVTQSPRTVNFLDVQIYKGPIFATTDHLDTTIHQKALNLYLYIPYSSAHPLHVKKAFIRTELQRYIRLISSRAVYLEQRDRFYYRLRARGYPRKFILHCFSTVKYASRPSFLTPRPKQSKRDNRIFMTTEYNTLTHLLR